MNTLKTILIELRYQSESRHEPYSGLVDGINDVVVLLANRFSLDILSVSHIIDPRGDTSITCTAVCLLNEITLEEIAKTLEAENHLPLHDASLYCFLEGGRKLSVRVFKISYN